MAPAAAMAPKGAGASGKLKQGLSVDIHTICIHIYIYVIEKCVCVYVYIYIYMQEGPCILPLWNEVPKTILRRFVCALSAVVMCMDPLYALNHFGALNLLLPNV